MRNALPPSATLSGDILQPIIMTPQNQAQHCAILNTWPHKEPNVWYSLGVASKVWTTASQLSFQHVPIKLRVLFANVVGLFW